MANKNLNIELEFVEFYPNLSTIKFADTTSFTNSNINFEIFLYQFSTFLKMFGSQALKSVLVLLC
jgi:hypothetical protein